MVRYFKNLAVLAITLLSAGVASAEGQFTVHFPDPGYGVSGGEIFITYPPTWNGAANGASITYEIRTFGGASFCNGLPSTVCGGSCASTDPLRPSVCAATIYPGQTHDYTLFAGAYASDWTITWGGEFELVANLATYTSSPSGKGLTYAFLPQDSQR